MGLGARFAQQGYNIHDPDNRQAYASTWPLLNILHHDSFDVQPGQTIYQHNLGFNPAFMIFTDRRNDSQRDDTSSIVDSFEAKNFGVDKQSLYYSAVPSYGMKGHFYIFNLDLDQEFQSEAIDAADIGELRSQATADAQIRFAKEGHTLEDREPDNYTIREDARSPMVHSVTPGKKKVGSEPIIVEHGLGYGPRVLVFAKLDSSAVSGRYQPLTSATDSYVVSTAETASVIIPYSCSYSIVIFKETIQL